MLRATTSFRFWSPLFLFIGALLVAGCGGEKPTAQIEKGQRSPAIDSARALITAPEAEEVVEDTVVEAVVDAENFETGVQTDTERANEISNSGNGQHFHLILDNEPYMANYDAGEPFELGDLEPGPHTLVAFPSRSYHESVKGSDAYDLVNFHVGEEEGDFTLDADDSAIIYSRPKGTYKGQAAERIMLDFYLHNVQLSEGGHRARYTVQSTGDDAEEVASITLTEWVPAFITGLESGTYDVRLQLLDAEGNVVDGPFNDTTREITVEIGDGQES